MLHGRESECAMIERIIDDARVQRSGALVMRGDAGVGKSALLEHATAQAVSMTVLRAVGIESESHLAFAALHQLLRPVLDHAERLPAPQADALRTAFGLTSGVRDRFLVSLAVLTLLADVAEDRPLLCVVDDAQWLDRESADALLFTARRLEAEGIVLLFAARDAQQERFVGSSLPELHLTGLSGDAASAVLHARVRAGLAPAVADRLVALTGGNPLGLHELPGILTSDQLAGRAPLPNPLPVSGGIERAFLAQVRRLPASGRAVLVIAAAEDIGDTSAVLRAADALGYPVDALEVAESAGLLRLRDAGLEFRHPLVRSAVYRSATATQRRAAHGALAAALHPDDDADRRAWHQAAATVGSDAAAADDLERSAGRAGTRGGQAAAAAAFERAAEISPDDASRLRRLVAAADAAWSAGLADRASGLLDRASTQTGDPRTAADISRLRGIIERHTGTMSRAYTILRDGAAAVASVDPERSASMLVEAGVAAWDTNHQDWMVAACDALDALDMPSDSAAFGTHVVNGLARLHSGDVKGALPPLLQVLSIARRGDQPRELTLAAAIAMFLGDDAAGLALYARAVAEARTRGEGGVLATLLAPAAALEAWTGRYQSAIANATEAIGLAAETRQPTYGAMAHAALAWVHAVQGREHDARSHAEAALSTALRHEMAAAAAIATWAIAHVELCAGRVDQAHALFESLREIDGPRAHPQVALFAVGDIVEAAVRVGAHDRARIAVDILDRWAHHTTPRWGLAVACRCQALLAGDDTDADRDYAQALELHRGATRPFEHARTRLSYGERLRRDRRRTDARMHLRAAAETFGRLGAQPWEERASAELRATGETLRRRDPSTFDELTPQELQIARYVGRGASNKEVAAQLFLSPRTIEYHLRKVFVKLGVASRAELILMDLDGDVAP